MTTNLAIATPLQEILGTDKRNPVFSAFRAESHEVVETSDADRFDYDVTEDLYDLPVPMLIIGSELMFPASNSSQHLLEHYGFGSAKSLSFKRMANIGHFMMLESPVQTASVLLAFGVTAEYQFEH